MWNRAASHQLVDYRAREKVCGGDPCRIDAKLDVTKHVVDSSEAWPDNRAALVVPVCASQLRVHLRNNVPRSVGRKVMAVDAEFEGPPQGEVVLYKKDGVSVPVRVFYQDETLWMPQKNMANLFGVGVPIISKHLSNIYAEGELDERATVSKMETVRNEGGRTVRRVVTFYNLDAVIAVGYRVNSMQATRFRQWATATLKEYVVKGFILDDDMLKNGRQFGQDYFDELLVRIRDIRASERRFYQKITDLFQDISVDYDKHSQTARDFFASVQNRFHYATSGKTAAEIIDDRADADEPHMGLTSWKGSPEGRIHSSDVTVAKNYLSRDELDHLNQLVTGFLDAAELRVKNHQMTTMTDCVAMCEQYIAFTGGQVLTDRGHVSKKQADKKALSEFRRFEKTQESDFDRFAKRIEKEKHG